MAEDKNLVMINEFEEYLENSDSQTIQNELPKLLKAFSRVAKRTEKILKQSDSQQLQVLQLSESLESTNKKVKQLLDNAGQGFLNFNKELIIGNEYSNEAKKIFKKEIASEDISELLFEDLGDRSFFKATLQGILEDDPIRQEILISLLQKEFLINNKYIQLEYKVLDKQNYMLILTDITAKKKLSQKVKQEQQVLKMVVETVTSLEQFLEVKSDYEGMISCIEEFKSLDKLSSLRKEIHTYKGLFAQKEMLYIVNYLHDFESIIDSSLKKNIIDEKILNITKDDMYSWIEEDIIILKGVLGDEFFSKKDSLNIEKIRIDEISKKVKNLLSVKGNMLTPNTYKSLLDISNDINTLSYHHIGIFFKPYEKLVEQLSLKLEKYINPLIINCEDIYVSSKYKPFFNSLVHIFRNSVDHGIESLDDRYEKEKSEYGTISCDIVKKDNSLIIRISDDGAGVDIEKIKSLAIKRGVYTKDEIALLSEKEILMIIFKDAFSTSENITSVSGRGVGLASIIDELNKINATMEIINIFGSGIEFIFKIPMD